MRRLRGFIITICLFERLFTEGVKTKVRCVKGLPEGAKLVNSFYDGYKQSAVLVYEHESFEAIPEGGQIALDIARFEAID